jgi:integrase
MKGYIRKRGKTYSYTVDIGRDPITGKRKQKTKGGFKGKKEAEKALNDAIYHLNQGTFIEPKDLTVKDLVKEWLKIHQHKVKVTTFNMYQYNINKWIIPLLGGIKVQQFKKAHANQFSTQLLEKIASSTAHKVFTLARMIFSYAVAEDVIPKNPFENTLIKRGKPAISTWTFDELNKFLQVVKKDNEFYYRIFAAAAYTGLRKGEVLGIRKIDLDFEKSLINVKQSIFETKEKGVQAGSLKTPSSLRSVSIDDLLISILKDQIRKNNELKLKFGAGYQDHNLIFCNPDGSPVRPSILNRHFNAYIEKSGVPKIRLHDLRHTHATLLLELGVNPKIVADRLGHSSVKITLDVYSHVSLNIQEDAVKLFSKKALSK